MPNLIRSLLLALIACAACSPLLTVTQPAPGQQSPAPSPTRPVPTSTPPPTAVPFIMPTALADVPSDACLQFNGLQANLRTADAVPYPTPTVMPSLTPDTTTQPLRLAAPQGGAAVVRTADAVFLEMSDGTRTEIEPQPAPEYELENRVRWSPDGRHLIYIAGTYERDNTLMAFWADGSKRQELGKLDNIYSISQWSADSQYVSMIANQALQVWAMVPDPHLLPLGLPLDSRTVLQWYGWSPGGHHLAYLWSQRTGDETDFFLAITTITSDSIVFNVTTSAPYGQEYYWSPDGRSLAAVHQPQQTTADRMFYRVDLYGLDGGFRPAVLNFESLPLDRRMPFWSPDSSQIAMAAKLDRDRYDLITFDLAEPAQRTRLAGMLREPAIAYAGQRPDAQQPDARSSIAAGGRMAAYFQWTDGKGIDVMNIDASGRIPFITGADDLGDPTWSHNANYVAAVWSTGTGSSREIHLAWMRADGSGRFDLQDDYWSVHNLRWLDPGQNNGEPLLAYIVWRRTGFSVEVVHLETGVVRVIVDGLQDITTMDYDRAANTLYLNWEYDNYTGAARYRPDGTQLEWTPTLQEYRPGERWYWSPDFAMVAVITENWNASGEGLYLLDNAGIQRIQVLTGVAKIGPPVWSPDGTVSAFTNLDANGTYSLIVIDVRGREVWRADALPYVYGISWGACS